ncbi:MAG: hypothetical protein WCJ30_11855 [Deltaproteobacteria bacterium]
MKFRATLWTVFLSCAQAAPGRGQALPPVLAVADAGTMRAAFAPPGQCVSVPRRNLQLRRTCTQSSPPDPEYPISRSDVVGMSTSESFDLDGDGQLDALVPEPAPNDCVQDFHFAVYVNRGSCGHRVGVVQGSIDVAAMGAAPRHGGLPDLSTLTERQQQQDPRTPAQLRRERRTYRFDGTVYREITDVVSVSVCHHCPAQRCETAPIAP